MQDNFRWTHSWGYGGRVTRTGNGDADTITATFSGRTVAGELAYSPGEISYSADTFPAKSRGRMGFKTSIHEDFSLSNLLREPAELLIFTGIPPAARLIHSEIERKTGFSAKYLE